MTFKNCCKPINKIKLIKIKLMNLKSFLEYCALYCFLFCFKHFNSGKSQILFTNFFLSCFFITALTVRYLTRRFIGEYRSQTDLLYRQTVSLDSGLIEVEIVDVCTEDSNDFPIEQIQWADSCLIVYSITDRESFKYATRSLANLKLLQNNPSAYLIANKADLDHLREVSVK